MKNYNNKIIFFLFNILFFSNIIFAQTGTISGSVYDKNRLELAGANVILIDKNDKITIGTSTDALGLYTLLNVPSGKYKLVARLVGYTEEKKSIEVNDGDLKVNFILSTDDVNLNPVVITASKTAEKLSEAPAAIHVLQTKDLQNMIGTTTLADALTGLPGVEIFSQGAFAKSVNTRGYNSIFSGAMLVLTDYRIARVPSLNLNALHFLPQQMDDIEQIELVLGPSAALYGPNSHRGVLHLITKSPFNHQGTTVSISGGERAYKKLEIRHAQTLGDDFAFKISASSLQLHDWEVEDYSDKWTVNDFNPAAPDSLKSEWYWKTEPLRRSEVINKEIFLKSSIEWQSIKSKIDNEGEESLSDYEKTLLFKSTHVGVRNYQVKKQNFDLRFDYKPIEDMTIITNVALGEMSHLEMTGIGMGITQNWKYIFGQLRMNYKDLFLQTFINKSNSGDTYRVDDGFEQSDNSEMFVVQGQYTTNLFGATSTFGIDYQKVTPMTQGTINGNYEGMDNYYIAGSFFQAKYALLDNTDMIFAIRADKHSMVKDIGISPKLALIYKMNPQNTFRVTASQAYSTPSSLEYFLDLSRGPLSTFPFNYEVRVQGIPKDKGFFWNYVPNTTTPYFYLANKDGSGNYVRHVASMYDAATWNYIKAIFNLASGGRVPLTNVPMPTSADKVEFDLKQLNLTTRGFELTTGNPVDIAPYENTQYTTFEVGYKGIINERIMASVDIHYDYQYNLGGSLKMESPFVFINATTFGNYLLKHKDKIGADSATIMTYANGIGSRAPLGVVSAEGQFYKNSALVTYRNIKTGIDLWGAEIVLDYLLTDQIKLTGNYSFNSANKQLNIGGNPNLRVYAAAPKHKYTLGFSYSDRDLGFDFNSKFRYVGDFEVENGAYVGTNERPYLINREREAENGGVAEQYNIDIDTGYLLNENFRFFLQITNVLNKMQRQYIGAPIIGRFSIAGVKYTL
ncbi:MAG: TonB-dependent receptor [Bacteroidetes bacterium]|nr:TonB-dependent receptor [Bacteroidota bacterium]